MRMESRQLSMETVLSWADIIEDTELLAERIKEFHPHPFIAMIAITRGGLIPAGLLSRKLDLRCISTMSLASYTEDNQPSQVLWLDHHSKRKELETYNLLGKDLLVVDDLSDSGKTFSFVQEMLPQATYATLYSKPQGRKAVNVCVRTFPQSCWLKFPWE